MPSFTRSVLAVAGLQGQVKAAAVALHPEDGGFTGLEPGCQAPQLLRAGDARLLQLEDDVPSLDPGSLCRGERTAKYNQLLRIEETLGSKGSYWGMKAFARN